ncbi:hypothetical protein HRS9139_02311 [Pyrenophora teres f. teres]|nr:hypothetical protein HRS9139_02311 [Pyrenophora teres f. teres]KAE8852046.1 hypothetical protein HRS9122_02333 [Pyrenophora teres f. teres]KAE8870716.1 hypothetical protein PTNB29_01060 [Pyrenophora teres f. teres]
MPSLKISIPTTQEQTPETGKPYTSYTVKIEHAFPRAATTVLKRYSDFTALDASLRSEVQSAPPAPLPPKSWLGGFLGLGSTASSPEAVEKRRQGLEAYLRAIETSEDGRWRVSKAYKTFLGIGDSNGANGKKATREGAGSQFGRDRVRDAADWLDKHSELKSNLQDARRWLTKREQATAATAQHEAAANAKKSLVRAGTLISALDEGLSRLGGAKTDDWSSEKLGEGEIRRRRDMISGLRKERDGLESVLNSMAVKAAISGSGSSATPSTSSAAVTESQKAGLFKGAASAKPSGRRILGAPAQETDRTRELDNDGVLQLQQQIIREQDEDLVDLATVVRRMKEMGVQINTELVEQNALMGLFEEDVERVDGKIKIAKKRIDKISSSSAFSPLSNMYLTAIEEVMEKHKVPVEEISLDMIGDVVDFSGPRRLTYGILKSLKGQLNREIGEKEIRKLYQPKPLGNVLIMPGYSFATTQNSYQPGDELKTLPKLVQHHYAGTWKNKNSGETVPQATV